MKTFKEIRKEIDKLDDEIIFLLEKRFNLVLQMQKQKNKLTDKDRETYILNKTSFKHIKEIYKTIFLQSKKMMHKKIILEEQLK